MLWPHLPGWTWCCCCQGHKISGHLSTNNPAKFTWNAAIPVGPEAMHSPIYHRNHNRIPFPRHFPIPTACPFLLTSLSSVQSQGAGCKIKCLMVNPHSTRRHHTIQMGQPGSGRHLVIFIQHYHHHHHLPKQNASMQTRADWCPSQWGLSTLHPFFHATQSHPIAKVGLGRSSAVWYVLCGSLQCIINVTRKQKAI